VWTLIRFPKTDLSGIYVAESCKSDHRILIIGDLPRLFELKKTSNKYQPYEMLFSVEYPVEPTENNINTENANPATITLTSASKIFRHWLYYVHETDPELTIVSAKTNHVILKNGETVFDQYPIVNDIVSHDLVNTMPTWRMRLGGHWKVQDTNLELYIAREQTGGQRMDESDYLFVNRDKNSYEKMRYVVTDELSQQRLVKGLLITAQEKIPFQAQFSKDGNIVEITELLRNASPKGYELNRISACLSPNMRLQACVYDQSYLKTPAPPARFL
jgi:hypothetical protein